jgi:hypothetical protein
MPLPDKQRAVPLCFDLLCYGWRDRWEGLLFVCPGDAVPERRPPAEERRASGRTHGIARVEVGEEKTADCQAQWPNRRGVESGDGSQ